MKRAVPDGAALFHFSIVKTRLPVCRVPVKLYFSAMDNVYWGIAVVLCCTAGYYLSYTKQKQDKYTIALALLMVCGLIMRVYTSSDLFLHFWDERYHALVAKNLTHDFLKPTLYSNPLIPFSYKSWEYNHIWVHKQPVTLWLMAMSLKLFGVHAWAARVPSVLLSTIGIKLVYDIAARIHTKKIGYVAAFLFSIHGLIIELASGRVATDHVDVAFMFFVLLGVWCCIKGLDKKPALWTILSGVSIGAAILCKWVPALIVMPVCFFIWLENKRTKGFIFSYLVLLFVSAAAIALPWQWYILQSYNAEALWEYQFNILHFNEVLAGQGGGPFYHFNMLRMNYGELVYIPVICFTYKAIAKRNLYDVAVAIWFWVPYLFFSFSATKMQAYTLFAAPAVFIMVAKCFYDFKEWAGNSAKYKWVFLTLAYGFVLLPIRYTIERIKPFTTMDTNPAWFRAITDFKNNA